MNVWLVIRVRTRQGVSFAHSRISVFSQYAPITGLLVSRNKHLPRLFDAFLNIAPFSTVTHIPLHFATFPYCSRYSN